jgi:hypothetical protein
MKWILEDLSRALEQLKLWQTWLVLGLIAIFAGLAYLVGSFAFRTDAVLIFLNRTVGSCRELNNGSIIFMFCGMIFFVFTAVLTLGELQSYFDLQERKAYYQSRLALRWGIFWGCAAIVIAIAALIFFNQYCR